MSKGLVFLNEVVGHDLETLTTGVIVAVGVIGLGFLAKKRLLAADNQLIPDTGLSARNFFEVVTEGVVKLGDMVMGHENRKYIPFAASLFLFLFACNIVGLIPGVSMPTDSLPFNGALAALVFILYNYWGIREVGVLNYLKHMWGPVWWIGPLLFAIEIISHFIRPAALSLRLYGNMTGDHLAIEVFTGLTPPPIPVIFYFLGTFVSLIQAFVFTLLTMVYIRLAVVHEGSDH